MSILIRFISIDTIDSTPCVVVVTENTRILFDVGEGIQRLCVEHNVRLGKVNKIFITRFSNDVICGIPGLCLTIADAGELPICIHGPDRLNVFVSSTRNFMRISGDRLQIADDQGVQQSTYVCDGVNIHALRFSTCTLEPNVSSHVCYVGQTEPQKGKFDTQRAFDLGIPKGPLFGKLKNGHSIILDNGTTVTPDQVLGPAESSRYFVVVCNMEQFEELLLRSVTSDSLLKRFCENGDLCDLLDCMIHLSPDHVVQSPAYQSWMQRFNLAVHHIMMSSSCRQSSFVAATLNSRKLNRVCPSLFAAVPLFRASPSTPDTQQAKEESVTTKIIGVPDMEYRVLPARRRGLEVQPGSSQLSDEVDEFCESFTQSSTDDNENANMQTDLSKMKAVEAYVCSAEYVSDVLSRHKDRAISVDEAAFSEMGLLTDASATLLNAENNRLLFLGTGCAVPSKYRNVSGILLQLASTSSSMLLDVGEGTWSQLLRVGMGRPDLFGAVRMATASRSGECLDFESCLKDQIALKIALQLKAVWISHPHADHHLGLLTVISERKKLITRHSQLIFTTRPEDAIVFEPLLVIAPPSILLFLQENVVLNSELEGAFVALSTRQLDPYDSCTTSDFFWPSLAEPSDSSRSSRYYQPGLISEACRATMATALTYAESIFASMGLRSVINVLVTHCKQSFGLILEGISDASFKLVYSGDTRPCELLVQHGLDATVLIHEATFEDDKLHEAVAKKHSTMGEALDVGADMRAHRVILTHFSQRYPSMPQISAICADSSDDTSDLQYIRRVPLKGGPNTCNFIAAFDFMHVSFRDLIWAPSVTAVLQRVFPPISLQDDDNEDEENQRVLKAIPPASARAKTKKGSNDTRGSFAKSCTCCKENSSLLALECAVHVARGKRKAEVLQSTVL